MSLIDRVLREPEFARDPLVLVDVGAAGGIARRWRRLARHAIAVGFEPDAREAAPLTTEQRAFVRWVYVPALVVPTRPAGDTVTFHLTHSPQCSSVLTPLHQRLEQWDFAPLFRVTESRPVAAKTLVDSLREQGIGRVDWLKCDTQGLDLSLFRSLPEEMRRQVLLVEFEPGLIDIYAGEDKFSAVLAGMGHEPFWLVECSIERTPRVAPAGFGAPWYRRLAPSAPGWGNLAYLHELFAGTDAGDRRAHLALWVFATLLDQPAFASAVAMAGRERFADALFGAMDSSSRRQLRWEMIKRFPGWAWRRARRGLR